jgi:phosphoglycolate phosphatase-like HAD superfamily hydrolase
LETYEKIAHIEDLVQVETSSADAEKSKPHPDIFEAALERLGNPDPSKVLVVGDSTHDIEAAKRAKLGCVAVLCGGTPEAELRKAGAIAIFRDPADLLTHYAESPLAGKSAAKA